MYLRVFILRATNAQMHNNNNKNTPVGLTQPLFVVILCTRIVVMIILFSLSAHYKYFVSARYNTLILRAVLDVLQDR